MKKNLKIFNVCIAMIIFMMICNCYNIHAEERDNQDTTYSANGVVQNGISIVQVENDETVDKINSSDENICVYNTIIEAGQYIRDSMELRVEEVCFKYRSSSEETDKLVADIMREALKYTGKSKDGDYLMFQYSGYTYTMTGIQENDDFLYTIELHINYYTTKQQEDELDKKIDAVLTELALDGKTQYEKIYEIYSYICRNVSYDYNNLENDDYILKYTAYAAMINGTAVCQGYSNLFYRMALEAGLQARIVAGKANNEPHSWNIVEVDEMFYFLDTTWDSEKNSYSYFLKGKQSFDDHKAEFFNGNDCINGELDSEYRISDIDYCIANTWYIHRADSFSGGDGSEKTPYLITLPSQLALIENYKDCYFSLMNNIDLKEYKWYPIEEFCGTFEGNGFTISNANIEVERNKRMGIFALLNNAVIRNVEFENIKIKSTINDTSIYTNSIGSVCGIMNGGTISNCTVLCDIVVNSNPGGIDVGGFAGSITGISALEKCYVSGNIDIYCVGGTQCGGFAGEINGEEVSMNMVSYIGNIAALSDGSMNDSSDEDVSWAENYGGLFGGQYGGKLYLNNAYDISNIAVDSLTKTLPVVGGVLGKVNIPSEGDELYANKVYCESKLTVSGTEYFQMYESASGRNEDINQSIGGDKSHIVLKNSGYFEHDIFYKQIDVDDYGQIYLKYERVNDVSLADVFVSDREFGTDTWNIKDGYFPTFINQDELEMQNIIKHNFVNGKCSVCSKVDYDFDIKGTIEDGIEWEISKGVLTLSGNGNIPNYEKLENSTLPPWKNYGFDNLIIKEGITGIGSNAFSNCESLTKVELSNSVISLGWGAFSDCINLQTINLPYGLDTLSPYLFSNCYQLKQIVMPDTVTDIGEGTFSFCLLLDNIVFSCNISSIGNRAFNHTMWLNCNKNDFVTINGILVLYQGNQENIIIPQNVNKISGSVFYNNEKILSVEIPDSVNEIGNSAFMNCSNLQSLKIPNGVTYIPTDMCCQCDNLQYVELPDSIKTIGYGAFFRCYKLNTIKLKYGIKRIDKYAFLYCKELGDIFLPEDIEDIDDLAFDGCESLKIHGFENSYSQKYAEDHGIPFIYTQHRNTENVLAESSCSNTGLVEYICEDCGKRSYVIIDKKDHTKIEDNKVSPTCTKPGLTEGSHCSVCNEVLQAQEEIPALGHTWDDGEVITAPTCTEAGVKTFTCETCGDTREEEVEATGHTVVVDNAVDPTCTKPGLTEGSHCSVCNEVIKAQEEIAALGHTWNDGEVTTAPTCTESGVKTFTCKTCGETRTEEIKATGHTVVVDNAVESTCTKTGLTEGSHCSVCNEVLQAQEEIPAIGHTWNDGEVTTAPTCTESGIKTFTCETCCETRTEEIKATGHTAVDDEAVAPTCTKTGLTAGSHCSVCNEVLQAQEEVPAIGHTWNAGEITTAPTCTETGVKTFTCETCGDTRTEEVKATGHTAVDDEAVAPTCTTSGLTAGSHCSVCNEVLQVQEEISALGHTWNDGEVTTTPTCTEAGVKTFTCEACGDTRTEEIKATGHTVVVDNAVEPTCTKPGLTEGSHCSVCNEVLQAQEEIPALGHTWNDGEITTAPTCTESGVKTFTCETCGVIRTEEVKATGHTVVDDDAVAPTCTKTGLTAGSHCSVCNEVLKAREEIPALGHTWNDGEVTTAPTCTESGIKTFTCETCGETRTEEIKATGHTVVDDEVVDPTCMKTGLTAGSHCSVCNEVLKAQEEIPALGHTWNAGEVTTAPTCTESGIKTFTCETCGETRTEEIKATGHTVVVDNAVDPTCTKTGLTAGSHCSVCNEVLKAQEEIPALGHTWNAGEVTTAPTCTESGIKTFTCETCGETRTEEIKATGHTVVVDNAVDPTCTKTGLTAGSHCSVCNETIKVQEEIPVLGHTWNDGEITTAPTCTEAGVKTFTCEICGDTRTDGIKATGHTAVDDEAVAPTCTKPGLTAGSHCSVCNEVLQAQEEIPALGHTWNAGEVTTAPTCTKTGVKTFTCETCGETRTEEVKATGHTVVDDDAVAPTCTKTGLTAGSHCSVCNEVLKAQEEIAALGHTWNNGEVTTAPTCTEAGVKTFTCETCGEIRTEEVKATGHTVVDDDAVEPTCTKTGLTAGSHCSVCNEVLQAQEEIPALGHTWNDGEVTTAPTCTETGVKTFTCETCGETRTEEIKATGHTVVDDEAVAPTCTKPGLTAGSHCSVCNEVLQVQEEIPALGHTWNVGEVTTAPTYTTVGVKTFTCEICGETRAESIPKLSRIDISKATSKVKVSGISAKIYNGKSQTQSALVVTVTGKKLKKDTDYKVTYKNNKKIGTATLTITGKNGYTGTVRKTFAIKTQVGKVYTTSLKYKVTNARVDGKGTVSVVGSAYKSGDRKFTTLKIADTVTIGGVKFKITKIEKNAFRGYKYLSTVTIGSNVTSIGNTAFYGCGKLTTVTVGKRVKTIGAKSFAGCKNLKRVKLLTTQLTKAGTSAFNGIKANATFALPKKYYNSYSKMIKKAGAPKKAVYKKF